jgi:uncharacterized protein (TIGR02285 family)
MKICDIHPVASGHAQIAACLVIVLTGCSSFNAKADESLKLGFVARPGIAELINGVPAGSYLPLVADIARTAHLRTRWIELPQNRLIAEVRANVADFCAVGTYKNVERASYAKFTQPFFRDKPLVVISLKSKETQIRKHANFAELAADTSLRVGLINGFSYGSHLDSIIWQMPNADRTNGSTILNIRKLLAGRIDYVIGLGEEASYSTDTPAASDRNLVKIEFADLAPGEARYFMCSTAVSDATIAQLNAAIHSLHLDVEAEDR